MANNIPPMPIKSPVIDDSGLVSQYWMGFFREMLKRVGGTSAQSNADLAASIAELQASVSAIETQDGLSQGRNL